MTNLENEIKKESNNTKEETSIIGPAKTTNSKYNIQYIRGP